MTIKILAIGDTADNIFTLKKFSKNFKIHLINFPRKQAALQTLSENDVEFFDSLLISKQVKRINEIKDDFDLCLVMTWAGARIAYLAGLNYIMYFVGGDIMTPPFIKKPKLSSANEPAHNFNFIERQFYRKVFDNVITCITYSEEYYNQLKKYRDDAIRMDRVAVDTEYFNENIKPIEMPKKKFTFLAAQRIALDKGYDIIWKALELCKSDFDVLQVEWFIQNTNEEKEFVKKLLKAKPKQVKFIPLIKRSELGRYFKFADAILGQMRLGFQGGIERDASYCKKPVLSYCDPNQPMILNGEKIIPPFLPKSKGPCELAKNIDKIVQCKEFREKLAEEEFSYAKLLFDPEKSVEDWENLFKEIVSKYKTINKKSGKIKLKFEVFLAVIFEKLLYVPKMRERNIRAWGKEEYERLIR